MANTPMGYQLKKIRIISLLLILSYTCLLPANAKTKAHAYTRFIDWCRNQKKLPPQTRKTIEVVLPLVETKDCDVAQIKLLNTEYLIFGTTPLSKPYLDTGGSEAISDLSPLSSLPHLTGINLYHNEITDLTPLL
jgi:internalin A